MQPGDLVHVTADNFYYGIGIIVELEFDMFDLSRPRHKVNTYKVMTSDGKILHYWQDELKTLGPCNETGVGL